MSNRHLARTVALQTLFQWDFMGQQSQVEELVKTNWQEFGPDYDDGGFALNLVKQVHNRLKDIDQLIVKYAPEWPLEQITNVDRNVLRLGIYELKMDAKIPPKVAINEAIELAKSFGGDSSGKFVNGVLGSIYRDMVEHGEKTQVMEEKAGAPETSAGGVVYRQDEDGQYLLAVIKDATGRWTFAKGHMEEDEDLPTAAKREVAEELGISHLTVGPRVGDIQVTVNEPGRPPRPKTVHYFLMQTTDLELHPQQTSELQGAAWFNVPDAWQNLGYDNARQIMRKALQLLNIPLPQDHDKEH